MSRLNDIERSIEQLRVATTAALDKRILSDAFAALEESMRMEWAGIRASAWQLIVRSRITKLAAAAVIIIAVLIGAERFIAPREQQIRELPGVPHQRVKFVSDTDSKRMEAMFKARDIQGLVAVLAEVEFDGQVLAAAYLGEIGDERALAELERLYLLAEEQLPEGYTQNPFAEPIEKVRSRMELEPGEGAPGVDANETTAVDVNEGVGVDANGRVVGDVNEIVGANVPAEREGVLDLFVVHKETREPLQGVHLDIKIQREGPDDKHGLVTDEQGGCKIEVGDLKTNYISIKVRNEDFVPVDVRFSKGEDEARITIPSSYTLALEPGTPIGGFVRNEQSEPVEAATVYVKACCGEPSKIERVSISDHAEQTDANGFWRCDIMPAKLGHIEIRLTHPNYIDDDSYYARSAPPIEQLRQMIGVMVMKRGVDLVGRVVDWDGRPIPKASVKQGVENTWGVKYSRTETDVEGKFQFKSMKPGTVLLTVQARGCTPDLKEIMVRKGMPPLEFRLGPAQTIRGRIVDTKDRPMENVQVSVDSWRGRNTIRWKTKTDAAGYFEWNEAPKDEVRFDFSKEGYMELMRLPLSSSVDEHIIVMYRALQVSGKVIAADSNEPLREFKLIRGMKRSEDSPREWDFDSVKTFARGQYMTRFDEPQYGYFVRLEAEGYAPAISRMLTEDEENVVIDFALEKGQGPSGIVYLTNGELAAGAKVALSTASRPLYLANGTFPDDKPWPFAETGLDGRFSFPPQIERYLLMVVHDEGYAEITDEELAADPNLCIEPWGRVEGALRLAGQDGAKEIISLEYYHRYEPGVPSVSYYYHKVPDANGSFGLERAVPGRAKVVYYCTSSGGRTIGGHSEVVEVLAGETVSVTIGGKVRPVVGRLVLPADCNEPVNWSNAIVTLTLKLPGPPRPEDFNEMIEPEKRAWSKSWRQSEEGKAYTKMEWEKGRPYTVTVEQDGTFCAEDVPAGTYQLQVTLSETLASPWWWGRRPTTSVGSVGLGGTLTYDLEVPDMNEGKSDEPLDLGTLQIQIKSELKVGDTAAGFEAETFDGKKIKLTDYTGEVVVVIFWTSERAEIMSHLDHLIETCSIFKPDERFVALGISLDRDIEAAKKFAKDNGLEWISCFPSQGTRVRVSDDYVIWKFPMTFVIGPAGRILAIDPSPLLLKSTLEEALGIEQQE